MIEQRFTGGFYPFTGPSNGEEMIDLPPDLVALLVGSIVGIVTRLVSNRRVIYLHEKLRETRETVIELEEKTHHLRVRLARLEPEDDSGKD